MCLTICTEISFILKDKDYLGTSCRRPHTPRVNADLPLRHCTNVKIIGVALALSPLLH